MLFYHYWPCDCVPLLVTSVGLGLPGGVRRWSRDQQTQSYDGVIRLVHAELQLKTVEEVTATKKTKTKKPRLSLKLVWGGFSDVHRRVVAVFAGSVSARLSRSLRPWWGDLPARHDVQTQLQTVVGVPPGSAGKVSPLLVRKHSDWPSAASR